MTPEVGRRRVLTVATLGVAATVVGGVGTWETLLAPRLVIGGSCACGLVSVRVQAAMLADIGRAEAAVSLAERLFAAGSIVFLPIGERVPAVAWSAVARPAEVLEIVREALGRTGRTHGA